MAVAGETDPTISWQQERLIHLAEARDHVWENRKRALPKRTYSGSVVYKRPKHTFTEKDATRILGKNFGIPRPEKDQPEFPFLWRVINALAKSMLDRLFAVIGFDDDFTELFWNGVMSLWEQLVLKVCGYSPDIQNLQRLFADKYKEALKRYLDGNSDMLLAMIEDLTTGGN